MRTEKLLIGCEPVDIPSLERGTHKKKENVLYIGCMKLITKLLEYSCLKKKDHDVCSSGIVLDLSKILQNVNQSMVICDEQVNKRFVSQCVFHMMVTNSIAQQWLHSKAATRFWRA